jgi:hypothetical protein
MTPRPSLAHSLTVAGILLSGCTPDVATVGPQHVRTLDPARIQGPYVPAGTTVTVRMVDPIDTLHSPPGQPFSATVSAPLRAPDGRLVVPAGASVHGTLVSTGGRLTPWLSLALDRVETVDGPAPISAAVQHAQRGTFPGPAQVVPIPRGDYVGHLYPYDTWATGYGSIGGGPLGFGYDVEYRREVRIPAGGAIELRLTRPLIPPGTSVSP